MNVRQIVPLMAAAVMLAAAPACAGHADTAPATLKTEHAWIRILPGSLPAAGYVTIDNTGQKARALTSASSPAYQRVMLHKSSVKSGVSHMTMVPRVSIPAHGRLTLQPGGYHLMLMHARHPVHPGDSVPVTLHFADGRSLKVTFQARPANAH